MRPAGFLGALGALSAFPALVPAVSVGDVLRQSLTLQAHAERSLVSDVVKDIEHMADCAACESLLVVLKFIAHLGNDPFVNVITDVCKALKVQDPDVCAGAIGLEGPILAHNLREMQIGTKTSQLFCLTIFGLCQWPDIDTSYTPPFSTSKPSTARPPPSGKPPLKVVHISDIHVDLSYQTGASFNCTKPICCRPYTPALAPGNTSYPAGPFGNAGCDSPVSLEENMYAAINALVPDRAFTIFTGDVVEGAVWLVNQAEVTHDLHDAFAHMQSLGTVYAVTGNHESAPVNSFPPPTVSTDMSSQWVYSELSQDWAAWLGVSGASAVSSNFGSYSVVDKSGLRIISVNTNFWFKQNFWLFEKTMQHDPAGMFSWLVKELEAAESAGQRAWIIGHMPMGSGDAFRDASYYFDLVVQRFNATIAGIFYGHTHTDEFQIAYSDYSNKSASTATMMSYIAAAMTPRSGNPTFRVYDVDPVTFGVLDLTVYYTDLNSAGYQSNPTWQKLYSAKEAYGRPLGVTDAAAELTPAFWHNVTALFESSDAVFQQYHSRKSRGSDASPCTGDCKAAELCGMRAAQSRFNCDVVKPGVNFRRRDVGAGIPATTAGECEGSQAVPILSAIPGLAGVDALRSAIVAHLGPGMLGTEVPADYMVDATTNG